MVVEIALLKAKVGTADKLREGLQAARSVIGRAPGYLSSVSIKGWKTLTRSSCASNGRRAHIPGFRQSPLLAEWRSHFYHLLDGTPVVTHYAPIAGATVLAPAS